MNVILNADGAVASYTLWRKVFAGARDAGEGTGEARRRGAGCQAREPEGVDAGAASHALAGG